MNNEPDFYISLVCLFCDSPMNKDLRTKLSAGDQFECESCGESNDLNSVLDAAKEKGMEKAKADAIMQLKAHIPDMFKK